MAKGNSGGTPTGGAAPAFTEPQTMLGQAPQPAASQPGDVFVKVDGAPKVVEWKEDGIGGFAADHADNADPAAQDATTAGDQAKITADAKAKEDTAAKGESAKDDAEKTVEAKADDKAETDQKAETEKKPDAPKVPKPNNSATRQDALRAVKLEAEKRSAEARAKLAEDRYAQRESQLRAGTLEERLAHVNLSREEITELVVTGTLPEPKAAAPQKLAEADPKVTELEAEIKALKTRAQQSDQQATLNAAIADIQAMEVPFVKTTPGAINVAIQEAADYYNKTGGKIDGKETPFRDYVTSFAQYKENELREAAPAVETALEGHLSRIRSLLGKGDVKGAQAAVKAAEAAAAAPTVTPAEAAKGKPMQKRTVSAPIGKRMAARGAPDEDKYPLDETMRDLEIKKDMGWA